MQMFVKLVVTLVSRIKSWTVF